MRVEPYDLCRYLVQSESNPKRRYLVDLLSNECGCIDYGTRHSKDGTSCKHIRAAQRVFAREVLEQIRKRVKPYHGP
jgi:hypothetical protein